MPMPRRIPKRGFKNPFRIEAFPINVATLEKLFDAGATVDLEALRAKGLVPKLVEHVKILGEGEITKKLDDQGARRSADRARRRSRRPAARSKSSIAALEARSTWQLDRKHRQGPGAPAPDPVHAVRCSRSTASACSSRSPA